MQTTTTLAKLRFGHETTPPVNARKVGREEDVASLAANILALGLGQALNVVDIDGLYYVADGNRRLAALQRLADEGRLEPDSEIKIDIGANEMGDELSLALNVERIAMHPADKYERFSELHRKGATAEEIGHRYGQKSKEVAQILALGSLAPIILDGWRAGELNDDAVEAFTLAADVEQQEAVYKRLKKAKQLTQYPIRQALGANQHKAKGRLNYVTLKAYEAAGGRVVQDLFSDEVAISDPALLAKLYDEKLAAKIDDLVTKEGWDWVRMSDDLPYNWHYSWDKVKGGAKAGATDRKKAGVVVWINHEGEVNLTYGLIDPASEKKAEAAAKKAEAKAKGEPEPVANIISAAMAFSLSTQLTQAAIETIGANPKTALAIVLAGMAMDTVSGSPVLISLNGKGDDGRPTRVIANGDTFGLLLKRLIGKPVDELLAALAIEARGTIDLISHNPTAAPLSRPDNAAFVDALEQDVLQKAILAQFKADEYFAGVAKPFAIAAIRETLGEPEAKAAEKLKKGELVDYAVKNVAPKGWLPHELRTASYAGPGAAKPKSEKKTRAKQPAAKPKARKKAA